MSALVEVAEFIETVLRLDADTLVKGYDGTDIGPSNQQASALANRTQWLKTQINDLVEKLATLEAKPYVITVNKKSGDITITPESIGAAPTSHTHETSDIDTTDAAQFVSSTEKKTWNAKQDALVSGKTLKTVGGETLLGEGDISIGVTKIETSDSMQFVSTVEKAVWNNKQDKLVSGTDIKTLNKTSVLGSGDIALGYGDVGADKAGTATQAVLDHVNKTDPHLQYLGKDVAATTYVNVNTANQPNGYLQLDENAKIPSSIADLFSATYIVVENAEERLKLDKRGDIIICFQSDNDTVYYLNANLDPSVEDNWKTGQSTSVSGVVSVFGRTGVVAAKTGDYSADQITETDKLTFVSSTDRTNWDAKQTKLVPTETIKNINNQEVLGEGNISITAESIGAAPKVHTHAPTDIQTNASYQFVSDAEKSTWNAKQDTLVSGTNIKTVCNQDITGKGNASITYTDVGAAATVHKHEPSDIHTGDDAQFVSSTEKKTWNAKQDKLVSGTDIKTLNKDSLLGEGDITITLDSLGGAAKEHTHSPSDIKTTDAAQFVSSAEKTIWSNKQDKLISGTTISTVFGKSLLDGKDIRVKDDSTLTTTIFNTLQAGNDTEIKIDEDTGLIEISRPKNSLTNDDYTVVEYTGLKAKQGVRIADKNLSGVTADTKSIVNVHARAYYKKSIYANPNTVIDYENPVGPIREWLGDDSNYDGFGYVNGESLLAGYSIVLDPINQPERMISFPYQYSDFPTGTQLLNIEVEGHLRNVVPYFPDDPQSNEYTILGITCMSSTSRNNDEYSVAHAFRAPATKEITVKVPTHNYWCSDDYFSKEKNEVFIGISCSTPVRVLYYGFQYVNSFAWSDIATPTAWELQGRLPNGTDWITIDTQAGQTMLSSTNGWLRFAVAKPGYYSQYRVLVKNTEKNNAYTIIVRLQFYTDNGVLIKDKDDKYLTVDKEGTISEVTDTNDFNKSKFRHTPNLIDIESIKDRFPIRLCSYDMLELDTTVITPYVKANKIFMQDALNNESFWYGLSNLSATTFSDTNAKGEIRVALTVADSEYRIYKSGSWVSIGTLTPDDESAITLISKGMTLTELAAITKSQWTVLLNLINTPVLGIAFARPSINKTKKPMPLSMTATVDDAPGWEVKSISDVKVTFNDDYITFTADEAGDYKFCYKLS